MNKYYKVLKLVLDSLLTYKTTAKENKQVLLTAYTNLAHVLPQSPFFNTAPKKDWNYREIPVCHSH